MSTLLGFSKAIVVGNGPSGRCGPGVQSTYDPQPYVPGCTTLYDPFARIVVGSWGFSPPGPGWTSFSITGAPASDWSVDGSSGVISGTGHHSSTLTFPIIRSEWYAEAELVANSVGPSSSDVLFFFSETPFDFIELDVATDRSVSFYSNGATQTTTLAFSPSVPFAVRLQVDGLSARAKVWPLSDDSEPTNWTFEGLAIDGPGLMSVGLGANMAGTYTVQFDNLGVLGSDFDSFDNRTIASGTSSWGTASGGAVWTRGGSGTGRTMVSGGKGYVQCAAAPVTQQQTEDTASGFTPADDFMCLMHLSAFDNVANLPDTKIINIIHTFAGVSWGWAKPGGVKSIFVQPPASGPINLAISATFWADLVAGGAYMRFEREGSVVRLKLWDDTVIEPGWQLTTTLVSGTIAEQISVSFVSGAGSDDTHGVWYDDILFSSATSKCIAGTQ